MAQKVLNGRLAFGRLGADRLLAIGISRDLANLHVFELRYIRADRIGNRELALLVEHHDSNRYDRLGHAGDREDRIVRHWRLGRRIQRAERLEISELTAPRDRNDRPRQASFLDLTFQRGAYTPEALGRKSDRRGVGAWQRILTVRVGSSGERRHHNGSAQPLHGPG
jgi:hypothetical protein